MIEENAKVGLHDCRVKHIQYQNQILTFDFEDGYYLFNDQEIKQSGKAQMHCYIVDEEIDGISVYIYKKKKNRKAIREDWSDNFIDAINDGTYEFEFVTTYRSYQYILFNINSQEFSLFNKW